MVKLLIQLLIVFFLAIALEATELNIIDKCWRANPNWRKNPTQLAKCSVGFAGKMLDNMGSGVTIYTVTDPSDPAKPTPGTLRYGATQGKKWIIFKSNMKISLQKPLPISGFTTIDGRGFKIEITGPGCLVVDKVTDVIIHGLEIHGCKVHGDAISLCSAKKVWIDHNTLYNCLDGLLDVTLGSTDVTISNNWFKNQDKVMLLGHDDAYVKDKNMRVTVVFNRFGPNCIQRMPRVRHGYAHVVNNYYQGWTIYAIGGSMTPHVRSESNYFIPTKHKKVIWAKTAADQAQFYSVNDYFENGAAFGVVKVATKARPSYTQDQIFPVANARAVKALTSYAGAMTF